MKRALLELPESVAPAAKRSLGQPICQNDGWHESLGGSLLQCTKVIAKNGTLTQTTRHLTLYLEMEVLQEAPNSSTFVPLSEHQSATPASFYSGPPVLHYHSGRCKVVILERDLNLSPALTALARQSENTSTTAEPVTNGNGEQGEEEDEPDKQKVLDDVDVWVTSEYATSLV
jgi:hypothetical protein